MNGNKTGKESLALHWALFSIETSKLYLEDMRIDFPGMQRRIDSWIGKLSFVKDDALCCMTPNGREIYRREIKNGDPLAFEHLFRLYAEMSPEQRDLLEKVAETLLKGELQIIE